MKSIKHPLSKQLLSIGIIIVGIIFLTLGILLPKMLLPIYEKNVYQILEQPLELIKYDFYKGVQNKIAYLYVTPNNEVIYSDNTLNIISATPKQILDNIDKNYGKFRYQGRTYYYKTSVSDDIIKISLTNDDYLKSMKMDVIKTILPILIISLLLTLGLLFIWSRRLVKKIENLKSRVDNIDNNNYDHEFKYMTDDELKNLALSIENMRLSLKEQEEYKSQMYQNISHDFKTPLTVVKSYIEAVEDGVEDSNKAFEIIKEQIKKLEIKVHSLLYLNKLNYIKDTKQVLNETVNISEVLYASIEKFKIQRTDVKWILDILDKKTTFIGTFDMWEAIVDNILNNFVRYAETEVKVTVSGGKIIFYNDGDKIDEKILDTIFTPYNKGIKGQFGLGLSIVKKTLALFGYEVKVKNEKKGVSFIIK